MAHILLRKYEESRQRRWELAWQTRTLAQFIAAAAPMSDDEGKLLKVAERINLDLDFEEAEEPQGDSPNEFLEGPSSMPIVATPIGTPVQQDPALLEMEEGEDLMALFERNIQIDADSIPQGSFEKLVPDSVRFAMARDQALAAAKKNQSDS